MDQEWGSAQTRGEAQWKNSSGVDNAKTSLEKTKSVSTLKGEYRRVTFDKSQEGRRERERGRPGNTHLTCPLF